MYQDPQPRFKSGRGSVRLESDSFSLTSGVREESSVLSMPQRPCKFLTFRMVRQGRVQLRDVRVKMQAQYWIPGSTAFADRDSHKGRVVSLALEQDYFTTLEQLQVWHKLDASSPLYRIRHKLHVHLDGIEVSVSAVDMASLQQVFFYKRYEKSDFVRDAVFENTLSEGVHQLEADHSKLDIHMPEEHASEAAPTSLSRHPSGEKPYRSACGLTRLVSARTGPLPGSRMLSSHNTCQGTDETPVSRAETSTIDSDLDQRTQDHDEKTPSGMVPVQAECLKWTADVLPQKHARGARRSSVCQTVARHVRTACRQTTPRADEPPLPHLITC